MKKKTILALSACLMLPMGFALAGCGHTHDPSPAWQSDPTHHWHACQIESCGHQVDYAEHNFNQTVSDAQYLDQPATETTKATYFHSCECGAKGTTTWEKDKTPTQLTLWQDMDKVYDGLPVQYPTFTIIQGDSTNIVKYFKKANQPDSAFTTTAPTDAGEYIFRVVHNETQQYASSYAEKSFTISKRQITSASIAKCYDGTSTVTEELHTNIVDGDEVFLTVGMTSKNIDATKVNDANFALSGEDGNNYFINFEDVTAEIYQAPLDINLTKTYDNKANFTVALDKTNTTNIADCDVGLLNAKFTLYSSNAGQNISVSKCEITGDAASNYALSNNIVVNVEKMKLEQVTFELTYWGDTFGAEYLNSTTGALAGTSVLINFTLPSKNVGTYSTKDATNPVVITGYGWDNTGLSNYEIEELVVIVTHQTLHGKLLTVTYEEDGIYEVHLSPNQNYQIDDDIVLHFDATNITEEYYNRKLGVYGIDEGLPYNVIFTGLSGADKDNYYFECDNQYWYPNTSFKIIKE